MISSRSILLLMAIVIIGLLLSCKDEITTSDKILSAKTNKTMYNSGESIIVNIINSTENSVFIQQCGEKLYSYYEKLDSTSSGGPTLTSVCRILKNYEFRSNFTAIDTVLIQPGRYRLKYKHDFENIMPELNRNELITNDFTVQ